MIEVVPKNLTVPDGLWGGGGEDFDCYICNVGAQYRLVDKEKKS